MTRKKDLPIGVLDSGFDFPKLSPEQNLEWFYRNFPDAAIAEIRLLWQFNKAYQELINAYSEALEGAIKYFPEARKYRKIKSNLDTKLAIQKKSSHLQNIKHQLRPIISNMVRDQRDIKEATILDKLLATNPDGSRKNRWLLTYMRKPYQRAGLRDVVRPLLEEVRDLLRHTR